LTPFLHFVSAVIQNLPASEKRLEEIKEYQERDHECQQIAQYCRDGWPEKRILPTAVRPYCELASEISMVDGLLMRGSRIIIPLPLRQSTLEKLHIGHQGITKC